MPCEAEDCWRSREFDQSVRFQLANRSFKWDAWQRGLLGLSAGQRKTKILVNLTRNSTAMPLFCP